VRGRDFAEALADRPHIFPKQHAAIIAVTEGKPTQHDAIESIINEETRARRLASRNFGNRVGVYATYVLAGIAFVIVAKLYLPRFLDASTQLSIQGGPPMTLVAISAVGTFLSSWYSLFIFAAVIVGIRALWERLLRNDEVALFIEKQVWRNYIIKQKKLSDARARALSMIAGMRKAGIDEIKIFEETAKAIDSPHFRQGLLKQAEVCRSGEATFEQSFGDNKHWGGEIISQISGAAPGTYATTMEEIVKDQDERAQGYEAAAAALGTIGHTIAAVLISGLIVSVMYFAQLSILITEARKMY
jgi:type II secretory pathway component PulF